MSEQRLARLRQRMHTAGLDAIALNPGPTLVYLTGLGFHLMERPTVLLVTPDPQPALILPALELIKLESCPLTLRTFAYDDNPASWPAAFHNAIAATGLDGRKVGVEANRLRFLELQFLQDAAPRAQFTAAGGVLDELRLLKDSAELEAMRRAVHIAQDALSASVSFIKCGVSEREIASELLLQLLRAGCDPELPFAPIVSAGPNAANPHAAPSDRRLQAGDLLVIDWGASHRGYVSDLTRTFAIDEIEPDMRRIYDTVARANAEGRKHARPGIPAGEIDRVTRAVIEDAGYGPFFIHRTGHGLGMEGHEHPYIFAGNQRQLEPGMTFTIEPGIYLPGRNGVRIEDNIAITETGVESLSDFSRELQIL
ncbi:MAG TPA: Xaa-Pro peptidase family protein [Levilinea sp.]|nr:Xaa-Pro peptidase family protein [Levilinea sp.]